MAADDSSIGLSLVTMEKPIASSLRRRLGLRVIVPPGVEQLLDDLWARQDEFEPVITCATCDAPIQLAAVSVGWPYGPYEVSFTGVPAYGCERCATTFFPEPVHAALAARVVKTVREREPEPLSRNPRAVAFARRYAG